MAFMTLILSITFYGVSYLFYLNNISENQIPLSLLFLIVGGLSITLLLFARISGFIGRVIVVDSIHLLATIGISGWSALTFMKIAFDFGIPSLIFPSTDYVVTIVVAGIVSIWIIESLLYLAVKYNMGVLSNFLTMSQSLPWMNVFSRIKEVKHYVHRDLLINHVVNKINKMCNDGIEELRILWITGTLDRNITNAINNFVDSGKNNKVNIKLLCPKNTPTFPRNMDRHERITIQNKDFDPGFLRAIVINDEIVIGLTTGESPDARTGFDPPKPVDLILKDFLEHLWNKLNQ
jgi:hypothetical protein